MRTGPHNNNYKNNNNNRNRNRNRRPSGGSSGGGGGSGNNRVLDSNGPDVKLRGTAQTIAEKYMQLGRDALSAGDPVMSESYYQYADHYYRVWLALQPAGQPIQFSRRLSEEELEDEGADGSDDEGAVAEGSGPEGSANVARATAPDMAGESGDTAGGQGEGQYQNRNFRQRDNQQAGQQAGRDKFRPRWPRRSGADRSYENRDAAPNGQPLEGQPEAGEPNIGHQDRYERPERDERPAELGHVETGGRGADPGNWEAPSFLKRPAPVVVEAGSDTSAGVEAERRPRGRKPRVSEDADPGAAETTAGPTREGE